MYEQLSLPICQNASATVSDFHARLSRLLDTEEDSMIPVELSSLKSCDLLKNDSLKYYSLKMLQDFSTMRGGRTFAIILETMGELGYFVEYQVLNSADFGVPQNRQRVFIVGHFGGHRGRQIFPIATDSKQAIKLQGHKIRTGTLDTRIDGDTRGTYPVEIEGGVAVLKVNGYHKRLFT